MIPVEKVVEIIDDIAARDVSDPDEAREEIRKFTDELKRRVRAEGGKFGGGRFEFDKDAGARSAEHVRDSLGCLCRAVGREVCPIHKDRGAS